MSGLSGCLFESEEVMGKDSIRPPGWRLRTATGGIVEPCGSNSAGASRGRSFENICNCSEKRETKVVKIKI